MGLDMFLDKETWVQDRDYLEPEYRYEISITKGGNPIDTSRIKLIVEEVGYWRKANAIHNWFVNNVQDGRDECQRSYVSREQLQELLELVEKVLKDPGLAPELLPTRSGFFFGGTDYDEMYFKDLEDTKVILETALAEEGGNLYYHASW